MSDGYQPSPKTYPGQIWLSLEKQGQNYVLRIEDDGIGMPADVLSTVLLEFGQSLWRSEKLADLYPGLSSNQKFNPTGRFGIGFFASFILGNKVKVMSKPYRAGDDTRTVLQFRGTRSRAELRGYEETLDGPWPFGRSTIVEIAIDDAQWIGRFAGLSYSGGGTIISEDSEEFWQMFALTVKRLVFCLDVSVAVNIPLVGEFEANKTDIFEIKSNEFVELFNRTFSGNGRTSAISDELSKLVDTVGDPDNRSRGTVSVDTFISGIYHIGGLTVYSADGFGVVGARFVTGAHQAFTETASRQIVKRAATPDVLTHWAKRQKTELEIY